MTDSRSLPKCMYASVNRHYFIYWKNYMYTQLFFYFVHLKYILYCCKLTLFIKSFIQHFFISLLIKINYVYRVYPKNSDKQVYANSVETDQMPQNAASDLVLHYLHNPVYTSTLFASLSHLAIFRHIKKVAIITCSIFRTSMVRN